PLVAIPEPAPVEASVQRDRAPTGGAPEDPILPGGVTSGRDLHAVHHLEAVLEVLVGAVHLQVEAVAALEIQPERLELPLALLEQPGSELREVAELRREVHLAEERRALEALGVADAGLHAPEIVAGHEAERRVVLRPELAVREMPAPRGVGEVEAEPARGEIPEPGARARIAARVPDEERLELGVVAAEEAPRGELEVHAGRVPLVRHDLRRSGRRGAPRVDRAEGRLLEDPPLEPRDREVLAGNLQGPVVG